MFLKQTKKTNATGIAKNQKGQGLIEYIILVALIAIASIGVMRVLGQTAQTQLANITLSLQGGAQARKIANPQVNPTVYSKKDLSDFMKNSSKDARSK